MWLVLCSPHDAAAHWAADGLARRGLRPLVAVSPEAFVCSRDLAHTIANGHARTTFTLPDGRAIDSASVRGVLNRLTTLPVAHLAGADDDDRVYAVQELHAVVLSALHAFGDRVINRPTPQGFAGRVRHDVEWRWLAARTGFRTAACDDGNLDGVTRLVVFDNGVFGDGVVRDSVFRDGACGDRLWRATPEIVTSAMALARLAETRLLGIDLVESARGHWWFRAASCVPDLRIGGEALLDALAITLAEARA